MSLKLNSLLVFALASPGLFLTGCSDNPADSGNGPGSAQVKLFIAQSDYQSGQLEWMPASGTSSSSTRLSIYRDATLAAYEGYLYIIERFGADNIIKLDPAADGDEKVIYQKHLGDNWNPQDIEFVSTAKAYISHNSEPVITVFNPSSGEVISEIDISSYTFMPDSNSSPFANDLHLADGNLYVMLQRCNGFNPGAPTLILKIDTATDKITDTIPCTFKNGYAMAYADEALYVSNPGSSYETGDGAIEKIDLSTKEVSTVISETELGGNPNQIVHKSGSIFYVVNYISWKNTKVVEIDMSCGDMTTLPDIKDAFGGIFYDDVDKRLYVGERDAEDMGVRIFENNKQTGPVICTGKSLPPTGLVVVR